MKGLGVDGGRGEGLASARVDDGLLDHHGEADRGKEGRLEHLPFSHELTHCKTCVASSPSHRRKRRGMRDGEGRRAKECIGRYKKGVKAGAVVHEIGPRTSERAVIYVAGNIGRPVPAVLVIYSTSLKKRKKTTEIKKKKEGTGYRDHANIIVDLGNIKDL